MASKFVEFSIYGKLYFLWILCFVKLSKGTSITLTCPEGWVLSGTMCYRLYGQDTLTSSTWDNAYRVCKGNGAEMVTVDDFFTNQNVGDFASAQNTNKFWTGMSEKGVTNQNGIAMTWNTNVAASIYQGQWSVRNPDKAHGDCVYIEKKDGEYVWTINSCLMKVAFVCQRTPCLPQSFHCDNGRCVNSNWRCDGVDDCGDFSDEVECAGRCSFLLDTAINSGRIQSPNHPSNYLPSRVCTWTIVGPEGSNIYLEFTSFNTEKDTDIVEVLIGGRTESTARSVARLSGQPSLSTARYRSYNNYMIIRFSTDSQTEKVGFTANYNSSRDNYPEELNMTARTTVSILEPPLFSSHGSNAYLGNRDYVWIIKAEERQKIVTLERMKIDLTGDDVIEIHDGDSGSAPLLEKYTASNNDNVDLPLSQSEPVMGKRFVFSTSNVMYIIMRTSDSTSGTGFSFQYRQGCIARYTADAGEITSPGYPNVNYANFQTCTWTIDIPSGKGVKVMLDRSKGFEIADNEDFIQVYTGTTDDSGIAAHRSGAGFTTISLSNDQPFHSPNGKIFIRFKSTAITNKKGFRLLYSIDCPDPGLTEASEVNPSQTAVQLRQFDNEFIVNCKNGYSFHSEELNLRTLRMKCMYGGKWLVEQRTRTIPQCKPNYCGEPVAVENGYISHSSGVVFGSFVTFTCFPGFTLLGSANITCQSTQWTSKPKCVSANCPAPPTISNGQLSSSSNQYAAIVNYTCNAGYQLIGAPIVFCQSTGKWTATAPKCMKITCPIPEIKNGRVSSSTLPKFQETLTVTCDVGYVVNGSATITCGDDRNFDALPNCINFDKCYSNNGGCSQLCTSSLRSYSCSCNQPGYVLFDVDGRSGYTIQSPDDGNRAGDVYHLGHSCVRQNCSEPAVVNNAILMTKRAMHRYMDKITYMCDLGYVKSRGEETFTCGSDGQWTPSQTTNLLECSVATCPVSDLNALNLKNRPTLSTTNPVSYLDYLNMTCDVPGKGTFVNQQQCLYDKTTNTYALYGAPYECGVIDCGNPVQVPGSSYSTTPSSTTYGATFTFTCENLQTRKGSSSTTNDNSVTCMADGNWDFGTLRCEGTTCTDPGYPNGGYLSTDVTGFEQDKVVTFGCNLAGFTVPANSALKCVLNGAADGLTWNGTTPTECQDTTAPVVSGCPGNMNLGRYVLITHNRPIVSDNSRGIKTFEVSPRNANTTLVLEESPITFTYTATDFNGNQDSCSVTVNVADEEPPKVTCPEAKTETMVDTEVRTFTLNPAEIVSSDNSGQPPTVEISPQSLTISASFVGTTREMTVTVRDSTGRTDQCRIQVYTAAAACSPLSLEKPLFGQKNCSATTTGYRCDLKCDQTYTFYDDPGLDVKTLECTNGGAWPQRIPACTPETQEARYTSLITVTYGVETAGQIIGSNCFDSTYKSVLSTQTPQTESNLKQGCSGGLFYNDNIFIDIDEESSFATSAVTITSTSLSIIYTVKQTPLVYTEDQYSTCSDAVLNRMKSFDISISKIQSTVGGCPNLVRTSASENSKGFICSSEKKKVTVNQKDYCLDCPAGTYPSAPNTCDLCPVNTYKGNSGSSACTQCGSGGTQRTGSTSQGQCQAKCAAGTFSVSGMPPCNQCARNSYWNNSTSCTACPNDGKTSSAGAVSVGSCINKCSAGSYSYDGYAPCRSCPKNYYQDQTGATSCTRCPNTQYTASIGSSASSRCQNAMDLCSGLNCLNGGTCVAQDNEAICNCPIGYYGSRCENRVNYCIQGACYNGGTCVSGATSYTCTCPSGTTGARCETDATDDCATAPCKNGGMCVNQLYNYRCLCTSGYSGTTCSSQTSKCNEQPCNSVGTAECVNYDNIHRICKCKAGYTGQDCETNIDDCASNPCLYGGTCTDLVGGYSCTCPAGCQGTRCQNRVNPCSLNQCNNGQCVDAYSMDLFRCICLPGYQYGLICPYEMYSDNGTSLTPFSTPSGTTTIGNCRQQCDNLAICQAYTFAARTCKLYQTAPKDQTITAAAGSTLNIKKCIYPDDDYWSPWYDQGPPNGVGEAEKRVQLSTYGVNVCNGTKPIDAECRVVGSKVASSGTGDSFSLPCGVDGIECTDQVNNQCEDYEVRYKCAVYKGLQNNTCDVKNHCLSNPCMNGGACSYRFNDFVCSCPTGYTGKLCQHDVDSCQTNPCLQGRTCIDKPGSQGYECQCPAGYGGSICQSNINECSPDPCDPVGRLRCRDAVNDYVCDCKPGYTGKNCSTEINECDAEPCMHGGNCTDQVNDFQCACPEGWTGKRCEMIYDECTVNNKCPSSSQCLNIFKKSYCKCPINTYGEVCEYSPDICSDLRPCLNSAVCTAGVNALSKCTCPNDDYHGIGCEIMVNHCGDPNKCENGGTCVNLAPGFRCDCPPGYSGANCSINVNDCTNNCPSTSTCIDMVNAHYCRCPLGKTGESCVRDLDTNYDLYFYLTSQDGYAALPYPIYLSGSSFSLSVWVRFYQSSLTGTFLTIFIAKSANSLASVTKFLSLDHQGLAVYNKNGQNPQRAAYQQQTVTDGQWNYVVVSWNKDNGFDLVVNSLRQSQIPTTPYTSMMAENIWVTLGADFDSTIMPKVNGGFRGYVSQLNIYNRGLSFENEMPQLIPDPRKVFSGFILRWNEFVYHRGVKPVYPSSAQKPCTGANCLAHNKKFPVFKTPCPSKVYKVSADRLTSVTWTEPIPEGATVQESTYKSGETFLWGKYTNMYVIRDEKNTSNFCSFNIYVMHEQCLYPYPPHLGTRTCERSYNPYFGCSIGCTDAIRRIDRYTPKVYTCGPSGAWNPSNRNIPLRFPSCGLVQSQARRRLMMKLAYPNISTTFCDTLPLKLREAFTSVNTRWSSQICSQPDCSDMTVDVNCQTKERRKRQTSIKPTSVKMIISTSMAILTRSSPAETLNVEEILIRSVLESQLLNFSTTIPNGSPDLSSFTIDSSESCPTRQSVVDGYCVKCGPGNFFNSSTLVCEDCPVGTYQDQDDQTSCTPCPQGSTTQTVASPSSSDCKAICNPGHYQTGSRCAPCGVGFYQSQSGMFYCDPCPVGQTTRGTTSTSQSECSAGSSLTNDQSEVMDCGSITVYYIIGLSCAGIIIILLVIIVCILVRRQLKLVKEMHSLHYVKTTDLSTQQQIDANDGTQYQELEGNHYHYLTPGYENSHL